jgi:3-hydroxyacyl-[acyl-carrier-protein] dehydratase
MPPKPLVDLSTIRFDKVLVDRDGIYKVNPHGFEFRQLDGIYALDRRNGTLVGCREVRDDEFWVRGHIPGRPIFPGVLMIETAAQLVSYYVMSDPSSPRGGFLGFGGVDGVKFRSAVVPGKRIIMVGKMIEMRPRKITGATQGFVDGQMVYEGTIMGMWI